jgi:hypothetical protein
MGRDKVKQRPRKNGEQDPAKQATQAKAIGHHQTKQHDKVEKSISKTLESPRKLTSEPGDLPDSYGETRVVLLPVEPYSVHVYWDVTFVELEKAKHRLGDEYGRSQAILRCYDITNIIFDGTNTHSSFDVHIDLKAKNRYIHLWSPEKSYFVELGFKTEDSQFYPIGRSNTAETPCVRPATKSDEHYILVAGDYDLIETVPAPIDVQPSYELTPPTASRAEPEFPSAPEGDRHFETRSPFADEDNSSRAEVHEEPFGDDGIESGRVNATAEMRKVEPVLELGGSIEQSSKEKERPSHKIAARSRISRLDRLKKEIAVLSSYERGSDFDLTEMSEKRFTFGVSSKLRK